MILHVASAAFLLCETVRQVLLLIQYLFKHIELYTLFPTQLVVIIAIVYIATFLDLVYRIAEKFGRGKFGEFGKSSVIRQSKLVLTINLLADLLIRQTFLRQLLEESIHQTFPLYGILNYVEIILWSGKL